ncbi:MAG: sugar phosphate isomerase/epimerase [Armatimonadetes bacterium]|nr:sugar phosphate isomerase/epimerase [Armatimonadota bacterium]
MQLGFHCWVYCQLAMRGHPWTEAHAIFRKLFEDGIDTICREVAGAGFDGLETGADFLAEDGDVQRMADALGAAGIAFIGISHNAAFWDPAQRSQIVEDLDAACERAGRLGGAHLGVSANPPAGRDKTDDDYAEQAETLRAVSAAVRCHGVMPNLHTYARDAADGCRELREMAERLSPEELILGPDLDWLLHGGADPLAVVRRFGSRIGFLHLRDRGADGVWVEAAGEGAFDFGALGQALREIGFAGPAVFEPAFADHQPTRPLAETLTMSAAHLRATLWA